MLGSGRTSLEAPVCGGEARHAELGGQAGLDAFAGDDVVRQEAEEARTGLIVFAARRADGDGGEGVELDLAGDEPRQVGKVRALLHDRTSRQAHVPPAATPR
jgi:hypothetical protein